MLMLQYYQFIFLFFSATKIAKYHLEYAFASIMFILDNFTAYASRGMRCATSLVYRYKLKS